uniref:Uncharacterized protein n=1 Tax=Colobus angolensis palliatus TaxID=336983 RepID=A0A2K5IJ36_COLAP
MKEGLVETSEEGASKLLREVHHRKLPLSLWTCRFKGAKHGAATDILQVKTFAPYTMTRSWMRLTLKITLSLDQFYLDFTYIFETESIVIYIST